MTHNETRVSNERLAERGVEVLRLLARSNDRLADVAVISSWVHDVRQALRSTPVEAEPVAWLKVWTTNIGAFSAPGRRVDFSPNLEPWLEPLTPTVTPLYARPLPNPSPSDGEVSEAEVNNALSAMWKAQGLGWTPHAAMRSALKTSKRGQP